MLIDTAEVSAEFIQRAGRELSIDVTRLGAPFEVFIHTSEPVEASSDALLPLLLPLAMRRGSPLKLSEPISPQLLRGASELQKIFVGWDRGFSAIEIRAPEESRPATTRRKVACFFSGGVDSLHSAINHIDELDELIFILGFEFPADSLPAARALERNRKTAADLGLNLLEVRTNIRSLSDHLVEWRIYHGALLVTIALIVDRYEKVYIPDSLSSTWSGPWGSLPEIDPLWSTERTEIVHDNPESRADKVVAISTNPIVLAGLRPCSKRSRSYNCGRCEKCLRTMIVLDAIGVLERCTTFPSNLDLDLIRRTRFGDMAMYWVEDNLRFLGSHFPDSPHHRALRTAARRSRIRNTLRRTIPWYGTRRSSAR